MEMCVNMAGESLEQRLTTDGIRELGERENITKSKYIAAYPQSASYANRDNNSGNNQQNPPRASRHEEDLDLHDDGKSDGAREYEEMMADFSDESDNSEAEDDDSDTEMLTSPIRHDGVASESESDFDFTSSPTPGSFFSPTSKTRVLRRHPSRNSHKSHYRGNLDFYSCASSSKAELGSPPPFRLSGTSLP